MHLPDAGLIVWLIFLVVGLISGIRRRAGAGRSARPAPAQPPPAPPPATVAPVIVQRAKVPTPPAAAPVQPVEPHVGTSPVRGMFGGSTALVRAIVAAEVLGAPKALQEQSIWSPRHSEPLI
jgi:hypothetical protein